MKQYQLVAYIVRSRGVKGEVEVQSIDGLPLRLRPQARLYIVPPSLKGVRYTSILSQRGNDESPWLILADIDDRTAANLLIGRYLLAEASDVLNGISQVEDNYESQLALKGPASLLEPPGARQPLEDQAIPPNNQGKEVIDEKFGYLGIITDESNATAQVLWTVEGGSYGQVLIPAVLAFVRSWDETRVFVDIPQGLLELNK
ncbi:MAG: hypothetical protein FWH40_02075 [Coriobacteriia bacterium]|nr:hypothetical protein [Coriobacteriia bacterium]